MTELYFTRRFENKLWLNNNNNNIFTNFLFFEFIIQYNYELYIGTYIRISFNKIYYYIHTENNNILIYIKFLKEYV